MAYGVELSEHADSRHFQSDARKWQAREDNKNGIVAYRKFGDDLQTFSKVSVDQGWIGNPFSVNTKGADTVQQFYEWILTGKTFGERRANEQYRQAIIQKILATPENAPILYYTLLDGDKRPSHATVIGYFVNNKDVLRNTQGVQKQTPTRPVSSKMERTPRKSKLQLYEELFNLVIQRFERNAVKDKDFDTNHQYYIVVDENGREFTKDDMKKSNGI